MRHMQCAFTGHGWNRILCGLLGVLAHSFAIETSKMVLSTDKSEEDAEMVYIGEEEGSGAEEEMSGSDQAGGTSVNSEGTLDLTVTIV